MEAPAINTESCCQYSGAIQNWELIRPTNAGLLLSPGLLLFPNELLQETFGPWFLLAPKAALLQVDIVWFHMGK